MLPIEHVEVDVQQENMSFGWIENLVDDLLLKVVPHVLNYVLGEAQLQELFIILLI